MWAGVGENAQSRATLCKQAKPLCCAPRLLPLAVLDCTDVTPMRGTLRASPRAALAGAGGYAWRPCHQGIR